MTLEEVVVRMHEKRYLLDMGKGKLSRMLDCSTDEIREAKRIVKNNIDKTKTTKTPKILIFDLETSPLLAYVWRMWDQNISLDALMSEWFLLSYSCKWLGEDKIYSNILTPKEISDENDFRLVIELWEFLDQADIVIAHNGKKFDVPRIKSRFLVHHLTPTSYYQQIDTLEVAKKEFNFPSNKLDALAKSLGIDGKIPTGLALWISCMKGDLVSLKYMEEYNRNDIIVLEKVYLRMRPYIKSHPNFNLYTDTNVALCPSCGSGNVIQDNNYYTQTGKYETYKCHDCGGISRKRKSVLPKEKELLVSIPGR
jgi:predicted RNA-binding Zn-ribbon protein involved in translation (DUF1610 family)/DNA polymerase elongation subunit (family B)